MQLKGPLAALLVATLVVAFPARSKVTLKSAPVRVDMPGPKAIRIRVAATSVAPCTDNILLDAKVTPGYSQTFMTAAPCVCVMQTYDDWPDVGWSEPRFECRPGNCDAEGNCNPLLITLSSTRPAT